MAKDDEVKAEMAELLRDMKKELDAERVKRERLEKDLGEVRKMLEPESTEPSAEKESFPATDISEVVDFVKSQKAQAVEKERRKKARFRLSTQDEAESEANELWQKMLEDAEKEVE